MRARAKTLDLPLMEAADGFALGALFATVLCAFDVHGLGTLIAQDRAPLLPLILLIAGLGGTFAAAAFGTGLCLAPGHDENSKAPRGTRRP